MEANELRLGNYVDSSIEEIGMLKVLAITTARNTNYVNACDIKFIKPIILTEEWHNKFGVQKNGFGSFEYEIPMKFNINLTVIHTDEYVYIRQGTIPNTRYKDDLVTIWNKDISRRYMLVHEWQNLYHSLTGEELTIKEPVNK